ncbi:hypothetical protein Q7689_02060 [Nocardiopsis tropica]|nr:hypothetical protein [Nocardiopsis tropica]
MVLRNRWTAAFGLSATFLFMLAWLGGVVHAFGAEVGMYNWEWFYFSLFHPLFYWFFLKVSFFTHVELKGDSVVVKNFFTKHTFPARMVSRVLWEGGVDIVLVDGSKWWCINLGGSLLGALAGFPTNRRCAREIEAFAEAKKRERQVGEGDRVVTSPHLNLGFLLGAALVSFTLIYLLGLVLA